MLTPSPSLPTTGRFRIDPLPRLTIERAVSRARLSSWRVRAIADPQTRIAIRDIHLARWNDHLLATGGVRVIAQDEPAGEARQLRLADHFARQLHEAPLHLAVVARPEGTLRPGAIDQLIAALAQEGLGAAQLPRLADCTAEIEALLDLPGEDLKLMGMLIAGARR